VDRVSIAGGLLSGLQVRPFKSSEKLQVRLIRNQFRPMSIVDSAFVKTFDSIWAEAIHNE
jgi:hypothetical protein